MCSVPRGWACLPHAQFSSPPIGHLKTTTLSNDSFADLNGLKKEKGSQFSLGLVPQVENNCPVLNVWVFSF